MWSRQFFQIRLAETAEPFRVARPKAVDSLVSETRQATPALRWQFPALRSTDLQRADWGGIADRTERFDVPKRENAATGSVVATRI